MAVLAYSRGKREINQYFTIKNAKLISLAAVLLLLLFHTALRHYGGGDSCEWLLSKGRYLGENAWQPYGCMMHKYKSIEAKTCLSKKRVVFAGDSRIRQLFYSFVKIIEPERTEDGNKHEDIFFQDEKSSLNVNFLWYPEANNSMKDRVVSWTHVSTDSIKFYFPTPLERFYDRSIFYPQSRSLFLCLDCLGQIFLDPLHMSRNTMLCHI